MIHVCVRANVLRVIPSGESDERNANVSKIEIAMTILRVSTIIIDLSLYKYIHTPQRNQNKRVDMKNERLQLVDAWLTLKNSPHV